MPPRRRSKSLVRTTKDADSKELSIFIAGQAHFIPDKKSRDAAAAEYVRAELEKGADQNPYAILAMT